MRMNVISVKGSNMELTEAIKNYLDDKLMVVNKLVVDFEPVAELMIDVGVSSKHHNKGPHFRCEFTLHVPGTVLRVDQESETLYEAIDVAVGDLRRQVLDFKERLQDKSQKVVRPGKE